MGRVVRCSDRSGTVCSTGPRTGSPQQFLAWIALAATFHSSALTMLVLPLATIKRNMGRMSGLLRLLLIAFAGYGLFDSILSSQVESYLSNYVESQYQSQGALIRVFLCLLPALIFMEMAPVSNLSIPALHLYADVGWLWLPGSLGCVS